MTVFLMSLETIKIDSGISLVMSIGYLPTDIACRFQGGLLLHLILEEHIKNLMITT